MEKLSFHRVFIVFNSNVTNPTAKTRSDNTCLYVILELKIAKVII